MEECDVKDPDVKLLLSLGLVLGQHIFLLQSSRSVAFATVLVRYSESYFEAVGFPFSFA
jgi:hypothetical protein